MKSYTLIRAERLRLLAASTMLLIVSTGISRADEVAYAAIYYRGGEQIVMNAQATPIPVPHVGSIIEVSDQGRRLAGRVRSVSHDVQRQTGVPAFRFYTVKVEIAP